MGPLVSTEKLEEFDESLLYPLRAEANTVLSNSLSPSFENKFSKSDVESGELVSCNRSRSHVDMQLSLFAPNFSSRCEDGHEKLPIVGAGIANLGNTCFFNAVLQCFTHSVLLVQGLYSDTHPTPRDCRNEHFCLICALRVHIERSLSPTTEVIFPWKFIYNLSYFSTSFRRYQQEDAHEFLQCFLDRLETSLSDLETDGHTSQTGNLVKQVFGGRVISKLRCCNCNHISDTYEPFGDLSLEIEDVTSLSTALESFTKVEHIEDAEMKFTCDQCKQKVSVEKQLMLDQIPHICTFHLKRFKNYGSYLEKIDKHVEFPLELDLQPYAFGSQSNNMDLKYELYAVVVHETLTSNCGHYYCYIRAAPDTWYKFDDSKVTRVSEARVLSEEAYILLYARQGSPWFSNFMETYKPSFTRNFITTSPKSVLENTHSHDVTASTDHPTQPADMASLKPNVNALKDSSPLIVKQYGSNHNIEVQKDTCFTPTTQSADVAPLKPVVDVVQENPPFVFKQNGSNHNIDVQKNTCFTPTMQSADVAPLKPVVDVVQESSPLVFKQYGSHDHRIEVQNNTCLTLATQSADVAPLEPNVNVVKESSPVIFKEHGSNHRIEVQKNTCFTPTNDSRTEFDYIDETVSPSTPSTFAGGWSFRSGFDDEGRPEVDFAAKPKHLNVAEKATCKRERNHKVEDYAKREAMKLCKSLPGARGVLLMAAIGNSMSKKSKKMASSTRTSSSKSNDRKRVPSSFR